MPRFGCLRFASSFLHLLASAIVLFGLPIAAAAEDGLDTGDTAWILASTGLVFFMTIPGLALFYGGLVRTKNVLSVLMQCLALTGLMTVLWLAIGYSLAFDTTGMIEGQTNLHSFIGGFGRAFLIGVDSNTLFGSIPEVLFFSFQGTFAIITPALIVGAFAERMRFSAVLLFSALWLILVYAPICHMTWAGPGGFFADMGVFDFAGGIVVHITAGVAALVACIMIGPRKGYPKTPMAPHNLTMCVTGMGMLWIGWYGFNGGSALGANGNGTVMAGIFGATALGSNQEGLAIGSQVGVQLTAALITAVWAGVASYVLLKFVDAVVGLRVDEEEESIGLDLALHDEVGYNL